MSVFHDLQSYLIALFGVTLLVLSARSAADASASPAPAGRFGAPLYKPAETDAVAMEAPAAIKASGAIKAKAVADTIVAVVAGDTLTRSEFSRWYDRSTATTGGDLASSARGGDGESGRESPEAFLQRYVNFRLKVTAAEDAQLDTLSSIRNEIEQYRQQIARPILMKSEVIDPVVRELYARRAEEIDVSHILIRVEENASPADTLEAYREMEAIVDTLEQRASFESVARERSEDPSASQESGPGARGRLGFMTAGQLVEPFEDTMYETPPGERSDIFRTQYGYHILEVHERRTRPNPIRIAHILIRPDAPGDTLSARGTADSLRTVLTTGSAAFDALAEAYSDDPRSAARGGELGVLQPQQNVPQAFREAAFGIETVGGLSSVVQTRFGYHIIKLLERETRPSLDASYDDLRQQVTRMPRLERRTEMVARDVLQSREVSIDTAAVLNAAYPGIEATTIDSSARPLAQTDLQGRVDQTIATIAEKSFTLQDLSTYVQSNRDVRRQTVADALTAFMEEKAFQVAALDLESTDASFREQMQEYRDGLLLFEYMQRNVWSPASRDTTALRDHFDKHREEYMFPERVRAVRLLAPADSLLAAYANRTPQEAADVARTDSLVSADTIYVTGTSPDAQRAVLSVDDGASAGPVQSGGERALYVRAAVEAPRQMTFVEARSRVIRDYQDRYEAEMVSRLRDTYDVKTYPEHLPPVSRGTSSSTPN